MKNILIIFLIIFAFAACKKEDEVDRDECLSTASNGCAPLLVIPNWKTTVYCQDLIDIRNGSISFPSENIGYAGGLRGGFIKTIDGGKSWSKLKLPTSNHIGSVYFLNENIGWVIGTAMSGCLDVDCNKGNILLKTEDGGLTWDKHFINNQDGLLQNLHFFDQNNGWAIKYTESKAQAELVKTTDGGINWIIVDLPVGSNYDSKIQFLNNDVAFTFGENGHLLKTASRGQDWESLSTPLEDLRDFYFVSESLGFITGHTQAYKTTDGGKNWTNINMVSSAGGKIYFMNENQGFIVTTNFVYAGGDWPQTKMVAHSTEDGGKTWQTCAEKPGSTGYFYQIKSNKGLFLNLNSVIVVEK